MRIMQKAAALTAALVLVPASAMAANIPDAGEEPGAGLSVLETFFWFIAVPGAIVGVVTLLWALGNWRKAGAEKSVVIWSENN